MLNIDNVKKIYFMGVGGVGMGTLAAMLKDIGYVVAGSDKALYSPMKEFINEKNIKFYQGYSEDNIRDFKPDLIIVGNVISSDNPEIPIMVNNLGTHYISMADALFKFFIKGKKSIVIAGTHGKTTTTNLTAWIFHVAGLKPTYFSGGISLNFNSTYAVDEGEWIILEGDEYDSAYFDKAPKFFHYRPKLLGLTAVEFDHADIYDSIDNIKEVFQFLIFNVPEKDGYITYNGVDDNINELMNGFHGNKDSFCFDNCNWKGESIEVREDYHKIKIYYKGNFFLESQVKIFGKYNFANILLAVALANKAGIAPEVIAEGLSSFKGVKRRQEIALKKDDIIVIDDFAHHPTAIRETLRGIRERYPLWKIWAVFEPRSNTSRRRIYQKQYPGAFSSADFAIISRILNRGNIPEEELLDVNLLSEDILKQERIKSFVGESAENIIEIIKENRTGKDLILIMTNGSFDGLKDKLVTEFQ